VQDRIDLTKKRLERQSFDDALKHLSQAESAISRGEWESANAQTRSFLESVFNEVARLTLGTNKTGGNARKELEAKGILSLKEAKLVQSFMDLAGGSGSHSGSSTDEDAHARMMIALGIAQIALQLAPELVRVQDVVVGQLKAPAGARLPNDSEVKAKCPTCGEQQFLSEATIKRDGADTVYVCRNGCQLIVVVSKPGDTAWPGRGYRLGPHVIRNACDLLLPIISLSNPALVPPAVIIPASKAALMRQRPDATA
jgi:predicted RNA-binding Zn-ribbon protein involved in translation (DUF1610 family)